MKKKRIKKLVTAAYIVICVVMPLLAAIILSWGQGQWHPEGVKYALFWAVLFALGVALSGTSLLWTLWGEAPRIVRYHTWSWMALMPFISLPILLFVLGDPHGGLITKVGLGLMLPVTIGLFVSSLLAVAPAVLLTLLLRGR